MDPRRQRKKERNGKKRWDELLATQYHKAVLKKNIVSQGTHWSHTEWSVPSEQWGGLMRSSGVASSSIFSDRCEDGDGGGGCRESGDMGGFYRG